jgi:hypothetical protein
MIVIKGSHVRFELADGSIVHPPASFGMIHDPDGETLSKCDVYVGPYKKGRKEVPLTRHARSYFGRSYVTRSANVDVPGGPWNPVGDVVQIFYRRPATTQTAKHRGNYFHKMKKPVGLSKCRSFYRLELPDGCIVNERGFVFP